jgi:hypothetical protein
MTEPAVPKHYAPRWSGDTRISTPATVTSGRSRHLIAEYARHNGHPDLLREQIDGETGR